MKNPDLTVSDFVENINQVRRLGPLGKAVARKLSGVSRALENALDEQLIHMQGIYDSMTVIEREHPELLYASRHQRIACGAGVSIQEANRFIDQFRTAQDMQRPPPSSSELIKVKWVIGLVTRNPRDHDPSWLHPVDRPILWRSLIWFSVLVGAWFLATLLVRRLL